jgi:hypothetical protein
MVKEDDRDDRPDRFASGTGGEDANNSANNELMPGVTGGGEIYFPESGREDSQAAGASSAEGTIGAVGEMDITGAPVEAGGNSGAGETEGGGPGGGAMSRGGTGPGAGGSSNSDSN